MNKTAIVFLTWNRRKRIKRTLNSFIEHNSGYQDEDIIIVDNGSTDGTKEYLESLPFNIVSNKRNMGCQKGKWAGWTKAIDLGYEFIMFVEDDFPCIREVPIVAIENFLTEHSDIGYVRLNNKKPLKRNLMTKKRIQQFGTIEFQGCKFKKSSYHFTCNPIVFRKELYFHFQKSVDSIRCEYDFMRSYNDLYNYQVQLTPHCFRTILKTRRKDWKN